MEIIGWIIWLIITFLGISLAFGIRNDVKKEKIVHPALFFQSFICCLISIIFLIMPWNKFHILWLSIIGFILSFVTTARIPVISRIILFLAYLYGSLIILGIKANKIILFDPNKKIPTEKIEE